METSSEQSILDKFRSRLHSYKRRSSGGNIEHGNSIDHLPDSLKLSQSPKSPLEVNFWNDLGHHRHRKIDFVKSQLGLLGNNSIKNTLSHEKNLVEAKNRNILNVHDFISKKMEENSRSRERQQDLNLKPVLMEVNDRTKLIRETSHRHSSLSPVGPGYDRNAAGTSSSRHLPQLQSGRHLIQHLEPLPQLKSQLQLTNLKKLIIPHDARQNPQRQMNNPYHYRERTLDGIFNSQPTLQIKNHSRRPPSKMLPKAQSRRKNLSKDRDEFQRVITQPTPRAGDDSETDDELPLYEKVLEQRRNNISITHMDKRDEAKKRLYASIDENPLNYATYQPSCPQQQPLSKRGSSLSPQRRLGMNRESPLKIGKWEEKLKKLNQPSASEIKQMQDLRNRSRDYKFIQEKQKYSVILPSLVKPSLLPNVYRANIEQTNQISSKDDKLHFKWGGRRIPKKLDTKENLTLSTNLDFRRIRDPELR